MQKELASDEELERAFQVQRTLLPKAAPAVAGYEIAGRCVPARDVAGDSFDYFLVGDEVQMSIADVMGKGVAAAIHAVARRTVGRAEGSAPMGAPVAAVLAARAERATGLRPLQLQGRTDG